MLAARLRLTFCLTLALVSALTLNLPLAHAGFDEGAAAFGAGDYAKALSEIRPLAEKGDPRCRYSMGVLYENGFGVEKNPQQAAAWYLKAAEQGNSDAQYNLGAMNEHGVGIPVNYVEAAMWTHSAISACCMTKVRACRKTKYWRWPCTMFRSPSHKTAIHKLRVTVRVWLIVCRWRM